MLALIPNPIAALPGPLLAEASALLHPLVVIILCIVAGIGTVLILPGRRESAMRKIGGAILLAALLILAAVILRVGTYAAGEIYFWIFSAIAVLSAIRVISHPRPVYSALYFVLTVVASAGLFVLLWAEFMAAALVLIYAGAILITYVFVIMLAQQSRGIGTALAEEGAEYDLISREPLLASAVGFVLMGLMLFLIFQKSEGLAKQAARAVQVPPADPLHALGGYLFTRQLLTLELAGVLLTLGMVGAMVLARRQVTGEGPVHGESISAEEPPAGAVAMPANPDDDNPHSIPVYGTKNPKAKAYPEA